MPSTKQLNISYTDTDMAFEREFDAPVEKVYRAFTDPDLIPQWWGPEKYKIVVDKLDFQVGGAWRFLTSDDDGVQYNFNGVYTEIVPNKVLGYTFEFEGTPGLISHDTCEFEELEGGRTLMRARSTFQSAEHLRGMVESGMESGMVETYERLDKLLTSLV